MDLQQRRKVQRFAARRYVAKAHARVDVDATVGGRKLAGATVEVVDAGTGATISTCTTDSDGVARVVVPRCVLLTVLQVVLQGFVVHTEPLRPIRELTDGELRPLASQNGSYVRGGAK